MSQSIRVVVKAVPNPDGPGHLADLAVQTSDGLPADKFTLLKVMARVTAEVAALPEKPESKVEQATPQQRAVLLGS